MVMTMSFIVNGKITVRLTAGGAYNIDGITLSKETVVQWQSKPQELIEALIVAANLFDDYKKYQHILSVIAYDPTDYMRHNSANTSQIIEWLQWVTTQTLFPIQDEYSQSCIDKWTTALASPTDDEYIVSPTIKQEGFIYLIKAITPDGHYKIGRSIDPIQRIKTMGVKLPFPIEPIHQFPTNSTFQSEKKLHKQYKDKRVNGEWFSLSEQDVQDICSIKEMNL